MLVSDVISYVLRRKKTSEQPIVLVSDVIPYVLRRKEKSEQPIVLVSDVITYVLRRKETSVTEQPIVTIHNLHTMIVDPAP